MDLITSWAGSPEVSLVSETGAEVRVHRTLLGLYTDQWRQNLTGLDSTDLVFILQGVGDQELEEIVYKIYIPLFDNGDHESTESSVELTGDYLEKRVSVIKKVEVIQYRENDQEPEIDWEVYSSE